MRKKIANCPLLEIIRFHLSYFSSGYCFERGITQLAKKKQWYDRSRIRKLAERDEVVEAPITPELHDALMELKSAFTKKFGRGPGPGDPVFFDPNADTPRTLDMEWYLETHLKTMVRANLPPDLWYASMKTGGLFPTPRDLDKMGPEDKEAWGDAMEEWYAMSPEEQDAWSKSIREDPEARAKLLREALDISKQHDPNLQ